MIFRIFLVYLIKAKIGAEQRTNEQVQEIAMYGSECNQIKYIIMCYIPMVLELNFTASQCISMRMGWCIIEKEICVKRTK